MGGGKCVYTCITGNYDTLIEVKKETGWNYICFTDMDITSNTWEIRRIPEELKDLSNVKKQRMIKVLPYKYLPEYEEIIWIDANITIKPTIQEYYDLCKSYNKPIVFKKHPVRNCIYAEMDACLKYKKDTKENIEKLRTRYEQENMPHNDGMYETNIIYRYNYDVHANALMKMWGEEILNNSHRDQLSLNYCVWKLNAYEYIYSMDNKICDKYFTLSGHKRNNYSLYVSKPKEPSKLSSNESKPILSIDTSNQGNKTLVLIENSQYNPIIYGLYRRFSQSFDTQIIDCPNRNYVNCYKKLFEYEKLYDWILLIKSNVSFEWASSKYIDTIIDTIEDVTKRKTLGLLGFNTSKSSSLVSGLLSTNITNDQFVLINTKLLEKCEDVKFSDNYGFGFISYLNNLSKKWCLDTLVDLRVPIKTYSNIESYDTPAVSKMIREFLKNNPL